MLKNNEPMTVDVLNELVAFIQHCEPTIAPNRTPLGLKYCLLLTMRQLAELRDSDRDWYRASLARCSDDLAVAAEPDGILPGYRLVAQFDDVLLLVEWP